MRLVTVILLALLALPALAQHSELVLDPLTAEPLPLATGTPPDIADERSGSDLLPLVARMPEGATKTVRFLDDLVAIFQDGAALITAEFTTGRGDSGWVGELGRWVADFQPSDAYVSGDLVFVSLRRGGLRILDVSNPVLITEVGRAEDFDGLAVVARDELVFVASAFNGVRVFDVTDPAGPVPVHTIPSAGSANGLHIEGDILLVAEGAAGLRIVDVSDPTAPQTLSLYEAGAFVTNVVVRGDRAYLSGGAGIQVLDISDLSAPTFVTAHPAGDATTYEVVIDASGDRLSTAGLAGLFVYDISDSDELVLADSFPIAGQGLSVDMTPDGNRMLLGDRFRGMRVIEMLDDQGLTQVAFHRNGGFAHKLQFEGNYLYTTDLAGTLRIYDVSAVGSGGDPLLMSVLDVPPNTQWLLVEDGIVYIADADFGGTGLTIVDATTAHLPEVIGSWASPNQAFGLDKVGDVIFLANGFSGLVALNIASPAEITVLGSLPLGSNIVDVAVDADGEVAYVTSFGGGMIAVDVSDPAQMSQISAQPGWGFLNAIDVPGPDFLNWSDYAYVADGQLGLRVVNISDPASLITEWTIPTASQARDVATGGGFHMGEELVVYVADDFFGLRAYFHGQDEVATIRSSDRGIGVAAQGSPGYNLVALAAGETGVYLFQIAMTNAAESVSNPAPVVLENIFPNPVATSGRIGFTLVESAPVRIEILDLLGRRVALADDGVRPSGSHEIRFDASGLSSGLYVVRLTTPDHVATARFTIVR